MLGRGTHLLATLEMVVGVTVGSGTMVVLLMWCIVEEGGRGEFGT